MPEDIEPTPQENSPKDFIGTKVALINNGQVLIFLRDDKPGIHNPGLWDLPGGGREKGETPMEVAIREINEELGLEIRPEELIWQKDYPSVIDPQKRAEFMVFEITDEQVESVNFGSEGQEWRMAAFNDFLENKEAVPGMQTRLRDFLAAQSDGQTTL